jgi:hypothetical protein
MNNNTYMHTWGVTNTGAAGSFGDTGFNPSVCAGFAVNNFHGSVWIASTNGNGTSTANYGSAMGVAGAASGYSLTDLYFGTTELLIYGPFQNSSSTVSKTNYTGRAKGGVGFVYADSAGYNLDRFGTGGGTSVGGGSGNGGLINANIALFAERMDAGWGGGSENNAAFALSFATLGKTLTGTQRDALYTRLKTLQTALGRDVP